MTSRRLRFLKVVCRANGHNQQEKPYTDAQGRSWMICSMCDERREIK